MDINIIVAEKTQALIQSGLIDKTIEEAITKTIQSNVAEVLSPYSKFSRGIKEKIEHAVSGVDRHVSLPEYNLFIADLVKEQYVKVMNDEAASHLAEVVKSKIKPMTKRLKISELLEEIEEAWRDEALENGDEYISIQSKENDDGSAIYVDMKHPGYGDDITIVFYNFKHGEPEDRDLFHIGYLKIGEAPVTGHPYYKPAHCLSGASDILYQYYAMGTKFEMDTEFEDIYVSYD